MTQSAPSRNEQEYGFAARLAAADCPLTPQTLETLQVNLTKLCNQACTHCHVDASPRRREMMSSDHVSTILSILARTPEISTLDITGGAPELHPEFLRLARGARDLQRQVIVRHNLTVSLDPHPITGESLAYLHGFFAEQQLTVVSSLPYHQEFFTDKQRGQGVFQKSIAALQSLNSYGYGDAGSGLELHLVYNPVGAYLPADQSELEATYKRELGQRFGIRFNKLFALSNMPIHRFKAQLKRLSTYEDYMEKLVSAFNPQAALGIMCRSMVSVSHDGQLYDCDFNQMLEMPLTLRLEDFDRDRLLERRIQTADHCFACTAGAGSSCGGSTAAP